MAFNGIKNILKAGSFGIQGAIDQAMAETIQGAFKGTWGVVSGTFKGIAGMDAGLHNKSALGKITGGLGYGVGRVIGAPIRPVGKVAFGVGAHIVKTAPNDAKEMFNLGKRIMNAVTTTDVDDYADLGIGLMGRRIKKPVGIALGAGAIGLGAMSGAGEADYNFGLRTAVNGIMDNQGVATTPGGINQTYIPIHRNKQINNHGADAGLVFAMHNRRNG